MRVIDAGHEFELAHLDGAKSQRLIFVKREGIGFPGNKGCHEGTNLQEVLRALISRLQYLDGQIHDGRNIQIIAMLRSSIYLLECRASERHKWPLILSNEKIEELPTCPACGHLNHVCPIAKGHDNAE